VVGVGEKGGIFEDFLSRGSTRYSTRFSTKFDAKLGYSIIEKGNWEACFE